MSDRTNQSRDEDAPRRREQPVMPRDGAMPAGLEEPPRIVPPRPQYPDIPQTYDPRVSVQLERAARDRAWGTPGRAAFEDLHRATDPRRGAGPRPRPQSGPEGRGVETAAPPRDQVVTFSTHFGSYNAGESAYFTADEAQRLADLGVIDGEGGGPGPGADEAPTNVTVPAVTQTADVLNCTMGEWTGEPTSYAYQWKLDGADIGTDAASYTAAPEDVGKSATCIVTATNAIGSTAAPPSEAIVVA